ncbi:putative serine/threonine-protein phosphatase 7-like [Capsicum annuum]|nr:putative serine/threonine-protein phosphatase 7-like [Capsicum annuum]KAF3637540.1 putative serine/threonine-protein phosphatase 7-like [Capsicum annuum]
MGHMSYNRVGRRSCCGTTRGFKLNSRRFSVQRLRAKFMYLYRLFCRSWRSSYKYTRRLLKFSDKKVSSHDQSYGGNCKKNLVSEYADYGMYGNNYEYRLKSYGRSNSFYAEAIADCLDFIKRNSLSMEEKPVLISHEINC